MLNWQKGETLEKLASDSYIQSAAQSYLFANAMLSHRGDTPFFCQPKKLSLTIEQAAQILGKFVDAQSDAADKPVELVLLLALQETFPC